MARAVACALAAACCLLCVSSPAAGQDRTEQRYQFILRELAAGEGASSLWWNGWVGGFAVATAGQTVLALTLNDRGWRIDNAVGAASSGLGLIGTLLEPRTPITAAADLRVMEASTPKERALRLQRAEALLLRSAQEEIDGRSWFPHVAGAATTVAASAVLWYGYDRYESGWINIIGGVLVTELQIATRPTAAVGSYRAYYDRYGTRRQSLAPRRWWITAQGLGLGVAGEL